jgi:NADPH-dependent curcumin reductase CurA
VATVRNRKVVLANRPTGMPTLDCFELQEETLPELEPGQVRIALEHLSIDAFIRTTLNEDSFHASVPIGGTVSALGVGRVVESRCDSVEPGVGVFSPFGAQTHVQVPGEHARVLDERVPLTAYLGALGLTTGVTSYMGIRRVGAVREGETVVVSAAEGPSARSPPRSPGSTAPG